MMRKTIFATLALAASLSLAPAAHAEDGVKVGLLKCNVSGGWGFVFGSSKDLKCVFTPEGDKASERYAGSIDKYGVDIGYTEAGVILWGVVAPSSDVAPGALAGTYAGATAEATAGAGVGANVLLGGGDSSITLQPVSISGQKGLNIAGGIAAVSLKAAN